MDLVGFSLGLLIYVLGGVTLLPIVALVLYLNSAIVPVKHDAARPAPFPDSLKAEDHDIKDFEHLVAPREDDVAAGYFAVCREYVPGGINGKPPERPSPSGGPVAKESPTVYQSIYRTVFDRKANSTGVDASKVVKRAANTFFVVLRHGHLILFDNAEQVEVRHVISLSQCRVSIYGGGFEVPEGELWIKRNCIRLSRKVSSEIAEDVRESSFYLFSDNCSEKEDFYHAVLQSQRTQTPGQLLGVPAAQNFETEHLIKLIRQLHASEDNVQARWLNAMIGRIFLALYKTSALKNMIKSKIKKKISRVAKPAFISSLSLREVELGDSAPVFMKPRLKEMAVDGALTLEADVKYTGNFKAVVAALARIDLGQRFKSMEVDLVLAGVLQRLDGHILIHIKPPPSNRLWVTFETMPRFELSLEPIVSSRQITYSVILRAIESRIREVVSETIVYPNWDDLPFFDTEASRYRGGIWCEEEVEVLESIAGSVLDPGPLTQELEPQNVKESTSMPDLADETSANADSPSPDEGEEAATPNVPMLGRSHTVATTPVPSPAAVSRVPVKSYGSKERRRKVQSDAQSSIRSISSRLSDASESRSQFRQGPEQSVEGFASAVDLPQTSRRPLTPDNGAMETSSSTPHTVPLEFASEPGVNVEAPEVPHSSSSIGGETPVPIRDDTHEQASTNTKVAVLNRSITSATAAAKKWGTEFLQRPTRPATSVHAHGPFGRGNPLPPPGQPLPGPQQRSWTTPSTPAIKRKPVGAGQANDPPQQVSGSGS